MSGLIHVLNGADSEINLTKFLGTQLRNTRVSLSISESLKANAVVISLSTKLGVKAELINSWSILRDHQIPIIFAVTDVSNPDLDFDDFYPIISKVFEPVITPYLVLHAENGDAAGLIDLVDLKVIDYSEDKRTERAADADHKELVNEFREELLERFDSDWSSFIKGIDCLAIPVSEKNNLGILELQNFLDLVPSLS
jgi:hypothetical protein